MKLYHFILAHTALTFTACSNKLDIDGDYKENAVVYAVLDPEQPIQFVKINKVFGTGASAAIGARISDSLFFDSIAPTLTEMETGRVIPLYKANVLLKDSGYFASSPNYLYVTNEKIHDYGPNKLQRFHYRLDLILPKTRRIISANTNIPDSVKLSEPRRLMQPNPILELSDMIRISFITPVNGKIFDGYYYFNYLEINKLDTNIQTVRTIQWHILNNFRSFTDKGNEPFNYFLSTKGFYDLLLDRIPGDTNVTRKILPGKVEITAGNSELDNFIQSSIPSISIVQKQSEYTNLTNGGIGIVAAKRVTTINGVMLDPISMSRIVSDPQFKTLRFKY